MAFLQRQKFAQECIFFQGQLCRTNGIFHRCKLGTQTFIFCLQRIKFGDISGNITDSVTSIGKNTADRRQNGIDGGTDRFSVSCENQYRRDARTKQCADQRWEQKLQNF